MRTRAIIGGVCGLLVGITLLCFWPIASHPFVDFDDHEYIYENWHVQAGLTPQGVAWAFTSGDASNWHPLTWLSHMLDCQLFGLHAGWHHVTNLLLHTADTMLLFFFLRQLTGSLWRSAFVAALFAWHPLHVESVAWASERKDVLSTLFFLLTLMAYVRYVRSHGDFQRRKRHYWITLALFACGLMSKPMLVTLPCVLLLLDYWPLGRFIASGASTAENTNQGAPPFSLAAARPLLLEKVPFFVLAVISSVITLVVQRGAAMSLAGLSVSDRAANALISYLRYVGKTFAPANLCALYPYTQLHLGLAIVGVAVLLVTVSIFFVWRARTWPWLAVGWFWFLGTLVPVIGMVQVGSQSIADRYMYIPGIGLFIMVVWSAGALARFGLGARVVTATAGAAALAGCVVLTHRQVQSWASSEALYQWAIKADPQNYLAYEGLGGVLNEAGRHEDAFTAYHTSLKINSRYPEAHYGLGMTLLGLGKVEDAVQQLEASLEAAPGFAAAHGALGKVFLEKGDFDQAAVHFFRAAELAPHDSRNQYNLGTLFLYQAKLDRAAVYFKEALRLDPRHVDAHANYGVTLMRLGSVQDGAVEMAEVVKYRPASADAHVNLGLAFLDIGRPDGAVQEFTRAVQLDPKSARAEYYLALALARTPLATQAPSHAEQARKLAEAAGDAALAEQAVDFLKQNSSVSPSKAN